MSISNATKPTNQRINKLLKNINGKSYTYINNDYIDTETESEYNRLIDNKFIKLQEYDSGKIKNEFIEMVTTNDEYGYLTKQGHPVPEEWFVYNPELIIRLTEKGIIFQKNYKNLLKRIEYFALDYPFIIPTIAGFFGGILSSLLINLLS